VFEAAARLESFNGAAHELNVTPSAVSHQVKALEESIGVQLFRRLNRRVALTPEGRVYLPPIRAALEQIRLATDQIRSRDSLGVVTLSSAPSFAIGWLMPRLPQFQMLHPDIEVRLISAIELVDFATSDVDAGIRTGRGDWPGLCSHRLMTEELVPVCSSEYAKANGGLDRPGQLENTTLLHELPRLGQWRTWLSAVGVEGVDAERGPKFQGAAMAVEAAIAGMAKVLFTSFIRKTVRTTPASALSRTGCSRLWKSRVIDEGVVCSPSEQFGRYCHVKTLRAEFL
jgi:LysR family glycine cleavage system transcriptional activator